MIVPKDIFFLYVLLYLLSKNGELGQGYWIDKHLSFLINTLECF